MDEPQTFLFTSEAVSEGHPDKICDQISDHILDAYLREDPFARVAAEVLVTTGRVVIAGEVRGPESMTSARIEQIARDCIRGIGYEDPDFHWQKVQVDVLLHRQSPDIAQAVDATSTKEEGAGDQGIMFGYACDETAAFMPAPVYYANRILHELTRMRKSGEAKGLMPDAKSQITLVYKEGRPLKASSVVVSTQHVAGLSQAEIREMVRVCAQRVLPEGWMCDEHRFLVNPSGQFVVGGPVGDAGLTGRKIIVDTYGGSAPHGGGAFSGKDPTKVDRSAAYAARYLAKNVVAAGLARRCTIQLAYAIGVSYPLSFYINTHGTGKVHWQVIADSLQELMDLSPKGLREHLKLNRPIYARTAAYGHFGREPEADGGFSWEKLDLVKDLQRLL
jgi:S-adenosylmethionine synthetase